MQIPIGFKLGYRRWTVDRYAVLPGKLRGDVFYGMAHMRISLYKGLKPREDKQRAETFWHEVTHAILHDMGHALWKNEKFVTEFSKRLNQVVHTARLR